MWNCARFALGPSALAHRSGLWGSGPFGPTKGRNLFGSEYGKSVAFSAVMRRVNVFANYLFYKLSFLETFIKFGYGFGSLAKAFQSVAGEISQDYRLAPLFL